MLSKINVLIIETFFLWRVKTDYLGSELTNPLDGPDRKVPKVLQNSRQMVPIILSYSYALPHGNILMTYNYMGS